MRSVQPVLEELDGDVEEAAASLGASRFTTFRRMILPSLAPAIAAGAALSFARAIWSTARWCCCRATCRSETEVASVRILSIIENGNVESAASVASVLLLIALVVIVALDMSRGGWRAVVDTPSRAGHLRRAQTGSRSRDR